MAEPDPDGGKTDGHPPSQHGDDLEQIVDDLEERVVGDRVDQERDEDDVPEKPAFEQDLDTADPDPDSDTGPGAEPSS